MGENIYTIASSPVLDIYSSPRVYTLASGGTEVVFENVTDTGSAVISGFYWDDGQEGTDNVLISDFSDYTATYTTGGVYTVRLSALTDLGVFTRTFDSYIKITNPVSFDSDIVRVYGSVPIEMPYSLYDCSFAPNEWVTHETVNIRLQRLLDNIQYLKDSTSYYTPPPFSYDGWLGRTSGGFQWNTDSTSLTAVVSGTELEDLNDVFVKDNVIYCTDGGTLKTFDAGYSGTAISETSEKAIGDPFINLVSVAVNSKDNIYVLDKPKNRIVAFSYLATRSPEWRVEFSWGMLGGQTARNGFKDATDFVLDSDDNLWLADSGNACIKKYSSTGSWINTIVPSDVSEDQIISLALDSSENIYLLLSTKIIKLKSDGTFIENITLPTGYGTPKKIQMFTGGDSFIYITYTDRILKLTLDGINAGVFADDIGENYVGMYHTSNYQLFVANQNSILKFTEIINILRASISTGDYDWTTSDIYVDSEEYIQPYVINKSFARIWDNIDLLRRSLLGVIEFGTLDTDVEEYYIRVFTSTEYAAMNPTSKDTIYVGINELVVREVFNRCVSKLYSNLQLIQDQL